MSFLMDMGGGVPIEVYIHLYIQNLSYSYIRALNYRLHLGRAPQMFNICTLCMCKAIQLESSLPAPPRLVSSLYGCSGENARRISPRFGYSADRLRDDVRSKRTNDRLGSINHYSLTPRFRL